MIENTRFLFKLIEIVGIYLEIVKLNTITHLHFKKNIENNIFYLVSITVCKVIIKK